MSDFELGVRPPLVSDDGAAVLSGKRSNLLIDVVSLAGDALRVDGGWDMMVARLCESIDLLTREIRRGTRDVRVGIQLIIYQLHKSLPGDA